MVAYDNILIDNVIFRQNLIPLEKPLYASVYSLFEILRGCSYGGELARLSGLARPGKMVFIPRSHVIVYLSSMKKFAVSLEKDCLIKYFLQ